MMAENDDATTKITPLWNRKPNINGRNNPIISTINSRRKHKHTVVSDDANDNDYDATGENNNMSLCEINLDDGFKTEESICGYGIEETMNQTWMTDFLNWHGKFLQTSESVAPYEERNAASTTTSSPTADFCITPRAFSAT